MTDQVSTLKKSREAPSDSAHDDEGLGIENGSFKWNAVEENEKEQNNATPRSRVATDDTVAVSTSESNSLSDAESTDHRFELKNISVNFPDGHLTCVTGPTASGKTALLVCPELSPYHNATNHHWYTDGPSWRNDTSTRRRAYRHVQKYFES